jgi:uncharacterized membrane protein SirB2
MKPLSPDPEAGADLYETLKMIHVGTAILTISGFVLRGCWMLSGSPKLHLKLVKIAPHILDTVFLLSGIGLIVTLNLPLLSQNWLLMKFVALVAYIVLGAIALGRGKSMRSRTIAFVLALATFAYIVGVALNKSTASWFASLAG